LLDEQIFHLEIIAIYIVLLLVIRNKFYISVLI